MSHPRRRGMGRCIRTGLCLGLVAAVGAATAAEGGASGDTRTIGIGATASRGEYGTGRDTTIASVPIDLRVREGRWTLGATLSWLRVRGDADVVPSAGPLPLLGPVGGTPAPEPRTTQGPGDLVLTAKYTVDTGSAVGLDIGGKAKLATADEVRGLGTGANDYGVTLDLYRDVGGALVFAGVEQAWLGDSPRVAVDQARRARAGISGATGPGRVGLMLEHKDALAPTQDAMRDATVFYAVPTGSGGRVQVHASRGLSDSSPDWGAGVSVSAGF